MGTAPDAPPAGATFEDELRAFDWQGRPTLVTETAIPDAGDSAPITTFVNEFWTSRQRAAHSLHEVSYRACFKPQLPRFFIERLTRPGDVVYDPFMGRGTTVLEAALLGRATCGNDVNPLSRVLVEPRLHPPSLDAVRQRLRTIPWQDAATTPDALLTFYHPDTLREICALQAYLRTRAGARQLDEVDAWIRMVAVNRLTGHSPGFFSVYTLPPNQATSVAAQQKINSARQQVPPRRDVPDLILRKSRALLADCVTLLPSPAVPHRLVTGPAASTAALPSASVVTPIDCKYFLPSPWPRGPHSGLE